MDTASPLAIEGLTLELLAEASRRHENVKESKPHRWLKQVGDILQEQFAENLSLSEIAETVGCTRSISRAPFGGITDAASESTSAAGVWSSPPAG